MSRGSSASRGGAGYVDSQVIKRVVVSAQAALSEESLMSFIQIIEYETDRADEIKALGDARMAEMPEPPAGFRLVVTQDRDRPNRYFTIIEFPSYEVAMENNARPDTDTFAKEMAALCTSGPRYYNLDVQLAVP
jgi:hypothetical protein